MNTCHQCAQPSSRLSAKNIKNSHCYTNLHLQLWKLGLTFWRNSCTKNKKVWKSKRDSIQYFRYMAWFRWCWSPLLTLLLYHFHTVFPRPYGWLEWHATYNYEAYSYGSTSQGNGLERTIFWKLKVEIDVRLVDGDVIMDVIGVYALILSQTCTSSTRQWPPNTPTDDDDDDAQRMPLLILVDGDVITDVIGEFALTDFLMSLTSNVVEPHWSGHPFFPVKPHRSGHLCKFTDTSFLWE